MTIVSSQGRTVAVKRFWRLTEARVWIMQYEFAPYSHMEDS